MHRCTVMLCGLISMKILKKLMLKCYDICRKTIVLNNPIDSEINDVQMILKLRPPCSP